MRKKLLFFVVFIIAVSFVLVSCTPSEKEPALSNKHRIERDKLIFAGSGTNLALTRLLVEHYAAKGHNQIEVPESIGSSGAIRAIRDGSIDLGLISRPLTKEEFDSGLRQIPYARVGLVIAVNPIVVDTGITSEELVEVIKGEKKTWSDGNPIIVLIMYEKDTTNLVLAKEIQGYQTAIEEALKKKLWQVLYTDAAMVGALEKSPYSIGFSDTSTMAITNPAIKALKLNGIYPNPGTIADGTFPLTKELYFVYKEGGSLEKVQPFLNFVRSEEGKRVILSGDAIPFNGETHGRR